MPMSCGVKPYGPHEDVGAAERRRAPSRSGGRPPSRSPAVRACAPRGADERGQALVEFALVLPVLMLVVLGILQFGTVYKNYIQLTNAADSGGRLFSIERGQSNPCTDIVSQVNAAAATLKSSNIVVTMSALNSPTATSPSTYSSATGGSCPWSSPGVLVSGNPTTVTATYPFNLSLFGLVIVSSRLSVSATENAA